MGLLLLACGSTPYGLDERVEVTGLTFPIDFPDPTPLALTPAFANLSFSQPVFLAAPADGTNRLFVVEKAGIIRVFANDPNAMTSTVFLDISAQVEPSGEQGLLGLAFDPDYQNNGYFYVYYTVAGISPPRHVVSRFSVSGDANVADANSETTLITIDKPANTNFSNHNGGMIAFGNDNMLYIGVGDGGSGNDPNDHGQNKNTLLGTILRIDPALPSPHIPADNPFIGEDGLDAIWAYGLRNPWRFSIDPVTDRLWVGDVGQNDKEEISIVTKGANLGWRVYEGFDEHLDPEKIPLPDYVPPVIDYRHDSEGGESVTGGYVYRGSELPSLVGAYVYADYTSGNIWALQYDGQNVVSNTKVADGNSIVSFGLDEAGELYVVSISGTIYKFQEQTPTEPPPFPQKLSETGLFDDLATLTPAPGIIEYTVNTPLWSDNAQKRRWIALPGLDTIEFDATEPWIFPVGTVTVKHFEIMQSSGMRRLETRVFVNEIDGWAGYTYKWNAAGTDADLLTAAQTEALDSGQTWYYPSSGDCLSCHTAAAGRVLGIGTLQLNREFAYAEHSDNQLRAWNHIELFSGDIGDERVYNQLSPLSSGASAEERARSYLTANCAFCHRPGGPTPTDMDMRFETDPQAMSLLGIAPTGGNLGIMGAKRIAAGSKETSILWERMGRTDEHRMPPLATELVDQPAIDAIGRWIDELPTP